MLQTIQLPLSGSNWKAPSDALEAQEIKSSLPEISSSATTISTPSKAISPSRTTAITAALSYAVSSIGIQIALKLTLTTMSFPSALFVALSQCIFMVISILVLRHLGKIHFPKPSISNMKAVQPLPLIQVFNVGCGLMGTKLVSIPMFTVLRRVSIPLTLLSEIYILNSPASIKVKASVGLLMLGSTIAALDDLSFNWAGYSAILVSAIATTAYGVYSKIKLTGPNKRTKFELLFYNGLFAIPLLTLAVAYKGDGFTAVRNYDQWFNPFFLFTFFISVTMGFVLNFAILYNTQTNGPLSTTIMGSSKNVFTTYLGIAGIGGDYIFTVTNFMGLNVSMGGALLYNYVKFGEKQKKKLKEVVVT